MYFTVNKKNKKGGKFVKLEEFLQLNNITLDRFAKLVGVSKGSIFDIISGKDTRLSTALRIEEITLSVVCCADMRPTKKRPFRGKLPNAPQTKESTTGSYEPCNGG